ncbi:uncharacterized protein M421DRAFT_417532 [Didymella exigua CBS 183.55]|uniref:Uncharacterized protein n=1 Tax=Didymella exigua CBS 183.55 TaxID=1150837 RepID=A0A6A5S2K9_9PLEO|nr:uncharacterized protein M421DRAFT_417532 [Didymella exigua CBS 183.55]KAF1931777.1 hypothetical protein M421DRAFT_417532 [Didymella exigua CBS 183.55]
MSDSSHWNDHELLVYILTAMEYSNLKPDYNNAPVPAGRTGSGCAQKIMRLKKALRNEMDAIKNGSPVSNVKVRGSAAKSKGKRGADDVEEEQPLKKRGRGHPKKAAEPELLVKQEAAPEI